MHAVTDVVESARGRFNQLPQQYNVATPQFPASLVLSFMRCGELAINAAY
jgi:hypothetical protein